MNQKAQYVWDYDITQEQFDALLDGNLTIGHLDRNWAAVRLIEWAPYREMIQRLGYRGLVEGWPQWRSLDFVVAWLPEHHPELLHQEYPRQQAYRAGQSRRTARPG